MFHLNNLQMTSCLILVFHFRFHGPYEFTKVYKNACLLSFSQALTTSGHNRPNLNLVIYHIRYAKNILDISRYYIIYILYVSVTLLVILFQSLSSIGWKILNITNFDWLHYLFNDWLFWFRYGIRQNLWSPINFGQREFLRE